MIYMFHNYFYDMREKKEKIIMSKISGSEIVIECLKEQGVDTVFGYPGGTILNVYDALYKHQDEINHVLTSHEQGAAHAADGYARATGKVGVCMATSGPGATNLVTGIATAYMDSIPVVAITANVGVNMLGKDSFQEIDIAGVVMPITKHSFIVKHIDDLAPTIRRAFKIAKSGRPGPVLVDITKNVTAAETEYTPETPEVIERKTDTIREEDVNKVIEMIKVSRRPFIMAGGGCIISGASAELAEFADKVDAPVCDTLMGKGAFDGRSERYTGMIGMHGSQASNMAVDACDLLIAVGCRFSDRVALKPATFAQNAKIVQIDIDRSEINKNVQTDHHIIGDARRVLELLLERVPSMKHDDWKQYVFSFKTETEYDEADDHLTPSQVLFSLAKLTPQDTIVSTDVGQHQMWAIQHFHFDYPGQLLTSGGFGTMGFGLGAAIGAQVSHPDKVVLHITGDGGFRMNCNELATEQYYNLPIINIVFNNGTLGMVRQWQTLIYDKHYEATTLDRAPDFVKLAEAYGLSGRRVRNQQELEEAIQEALQCGHGYIIDCMIDIDEKVRPMVGGGSHITEFMLN